MPEPEAPRVVPDVTQRRSDVGIIATPATLARIMAEAHAGAVITCDPAQPWVGNWAITRPAGAGRVYVTSAHDAQPVRFLTMQPAPVFTAAGPVGAVHFVNCEITLDPTVNYSGGQSLVQLGTQEHDGQQPRSFVFEKTRVFGNPGQDVRRGILANCADFAFLTGRIEEIHQRGSDSQAICGWNGSQGHLIRDATLEAAGENVMYGGSDSTSAAMAPSDLTLERVTLNKPLEWKGKGWTVKNHLELKSAQRVQVTGLHTLHCWAGEGQSGYSIVLTPRNQGGMNPWTRVADVSLQHVRLTDCAMGLNVLGTDDLAPSQKTERILIDNLLTEGWMNRFLYLQGATDLTLRRVTALSVANTVIEFGPVVAEGLRLTASVLPYGYYFLRADAMASGQPTLTKWAPGAVVTGNVFVGDPWGKNPPPGNVTVATPALVPVGAGCDQAALAAAMVAAVPVPPPPSLSLESLDARVTALERKAAP